MNKDSKKYSCMLLLILIAQIVTICFFGVQKTGYHQDEYYSYFSANRSLGFYYPDREWVDTDTLKNEFVVQKGEGFNYKLVHLVQSWDVHPPLFYDLLHTACSLSPGVFSKWQGLIVNIVAFVISYILLSSLAKSVGMSKDLRMILMLAYGFNPMTISCVMFVRMYMWLTVFILALALCHMRLISLIKKYYSGSELTGYTLSKPFDAKFHGEFIKNVLSIALISFFGFLTHYYFLVFMGVMGFAFGIWFMFLMPKRKEFNGEEFVADAVSMAVRGRYILLYAFGCAVALGGAVLLYPASASHIFKGYRGREAQAAFTDGTNILERFGFFMGLMDKYLVAGLAWIIMIMVVLAVIGLFFFIRIKGEKDKLHIAHIRILFAASLGYFLLIAKTALLLGNTSNRYEMPVYPIMLLLAVYFTRIGVRVIVGNRKIKGIYIPVLATLVIFVALTFKGLAIDRNVLFLYQEDGDRIAYAREAGDAGIPVVVMFNEKTPDNIWRLTDELLKYDRLYYVSEDNTSEIDDSGITGASEIIVYAADHENRDKILENIKESNPGVSGIEEISIKDMWTLYRIK